MYKKICFLFIAIGLVVLSSFTYSETQKKVKCLIQMKSYEGERAYAVISLINPDNEYEETLYVNGKDDEWYYDITNWWSFYGKKRTELDGISGATIGGGEQAICVFAIDEEKINKGYKIVFETAVEDEEYFPKDLEFELTSENLKAKIAGSGYINFVRMMAYN